MPEAGQPSRQLQRHVHWVPRLQLCATPMWHAGCFPVLGLSAGACPSPAVSPNQKLELNWTPSPSHLD
jgi:hypothetical protein